jgi:hypothetical protein
LCQLCYIAVLTLSLFRGIATASLNKAVSNIQEQSILALSVTFYLIFVNFMEKKWIKLKNYQTFSADDS